MKKTILIALLLFPLLCFSCSNEPKFIHWTEEPKAVCYYCSSLSQVNKLLEEHTNGNPIKKSDFFTVLTSRSATKEFFEYFYDQYAENWKNGYYVLKGDTVDKVFYFVFEKGVPMMYGNDFISENKSKRCELIHYTKYKELTNNN